MKVSVVIRTRNEEKTVGDLLEMLKKQTFKDFETILVDNESKDKTLEIVRKYKIDKFISIPKNKFSHPKSLNLAISKARGDLIVITNGHCVPFSNTWIADGIKNFKNPKVAAITGYYTDGGNPKKYHKIKLPIANLSNTNSIIRKDLWKEYKFDETLSGAEDYDWGLEMRSRGYKVIKEPGLNVKHFHTITPERKKYWAEMREIIDKKKRPSN